MNVSHAFNFVLRSYPCIILCEIIEAGDLFCMRGPDWKSKSLYRLIVRYIFFLKGPNRYILGSNYIFERMHTCMVTKFVNERDVGVVCRTSVSD